MTSVDAKQRVRGFTLLEIIVALAILAGVAASVSQIFASGVDTTLSVEKESYAYVHAESKLNQLLLLEDVREGNGEGEIENTPYRYRVEVTEQEYPGEARGFELMHIALTIMWGEGKYESDIMLEALKTQVKQ